MENYFEQGPIRPPSEARSLLIRSTRNCPWGKCAFCHNYKNTRFQLRDLEEIKREITVIREIKDRITEISWKLGQGGQINNNLLLYLYNGDFHPQVQHIAVWLHFGGQTVFLQDGDTLIMKTDDIIELLSFLRENFPTVNRITSYCRSKTACHKSVEDLRRIHEAGLSRLHVGLESGFDPLLKFMRKGVTAADHIEGGRRIVESGISLTEFVMPGLGGTRWSHQHAVETAKVLNAINPEFIRLRTLLVRQGTDLYEMVQRGEFQPLSEDAIVNEIRVFIENLDGIGSQIASDHVLNLLEELEGKLPGEKETLLGILQRYTSLTEEDRMIFRLGRRAGVYRSLNDLENSHQYQRIRSELDRLSLKDSASLDEMINRICQSFLP